MSKAILISIKPKYVVDILNHKKTIEVRKSIPKCDLPIDVYIYCTKEKILGNLIKVGSQENSDLVGKNTIIGINKGFMRKGDIDLQGKVVAKFTLNKVEHFEREYSSRYIDDFYGDKGEPLNKKFYKKACLTEKELFDYIGSGSGYAWHIDNLEIFDKPKELNEFMSIKQFNKYKKDLNEAYEEDEITLSRLYNGDALDDECANCVELLEMTKWCYGLTKAPQSFCYVEVEE